MSSIFLSLDQALEIHRDQIERYGGALGLRDLGLLESALAVPGARFEGECFHSDIFEMAAAYLFHIVKNHPFVDGNKRVGATASLIFLELNGIELEISNNALADLVLSVAAGNANKAAVAEFFRKRAV